MQKLIAASLLVMVTTAAHGSDFTYHFADGMDNDAAGVDLGGDGSSGEIQIAEGEVGSTAITQDGLTITMYATPHIAGDLTGQFNHNTGDFGIDSEGTDTSDAFDYTGGDGTESMEFWFDHAGSLASMNFDRLENDESLTLALDGGPTVSYSGDDTESSDILTDINMDFAQNQHITLSPAADTGTDYFGLESITLNAAVIPEPSILALLSLTLTTLSLIRRPRHIRK